MNQLTVLDLFSGIGGFSLGLDRTEGFRTVAFCEREPYARAVLAEHWPGVPCFGDVRELGRGALDAAGVGRVDVVCGGFPCQDISLAGKGAGLAGERSGLWFEFARIIAETRPRYVIAENVSALRSRGLDVVLGGLAALGYDAEWHCIPAAAVGAPHRRDRVWTIAYPNGEGEHDGAFDAEVGSASKPLGHAECIGRHAGRNEHTGHDGQQLGAAGQHTGAVADASGARLEGQCLSGGIREEIASLSGASWWLSEPGVGRVANGVPSRVDRLRCLGNAVVPQIPEAIGQAILTRELAVSWQETAA